MNSAAVKLRLRAQTIFYSRMFASEQGAALNVDRARTCFRYISEPFPCGEFVFCARGHSHLRLCDSFLGHKVGNYNPHK